MLPPLHSSSALTSLHKRSRSRAEDFILVVFTFTAAADIRQVQRLNIVDYIPPEAVSSGWKKMGSVLNSSSSGRLFPPEVEAAAVNIVAAMDNVIAMLTFAKTATGRHGAKRIRTLKGSGRGMLGVSNTTRERTPHKVVCTQRVYRIE